MKSKEKRQLAKFRRQKRQCSISKNIATIFLSQKWNINASLQSNKMYVFELTIQLNDRSENSVIFR